MRKIWCQPEKQDFRGKYLYHDDFSISVNAQNLSGAYDSIHLRIHFEILDRFHKNTNYEFNEWLKSHCSRIMKIFDDKKKVSDLKINI